MRRRLAAAAGLLAATVLAVAGPAVAGAAATTASPSPSTTPSPSPSPSPSASPAVSRSASPAPSPSASPAPASTSAALDRLRGQIDAAVVSALASQQRLADQLAVSTRQEQALNDQIAASDAEIAKLNEQIAALDEQIRTTQERIDLERGEISALARALGRQPSSVLLVIARSSSLADALRRGTDLVVAGRRAHDLQVRLEADLERLSGQRASLERDLDAQTSLESSLEDALSRLQDALAREQIVADALGTLVAQFQAAEGVLPAQPPDVTAELLAVLEAQQESLNAASFEQAWSQARIGAAGFQVLTVAARAPTVELLDPEPGAALTQPFGPTDLWFEPPLAGYPHFHTGVDLAAPAGTPVLAAADGVVTAVGSSPGGYGTYVVLAHPDGVQTLYGHLAAAAVALGQKVAAGDPVGAEGSTGFSTGPHLHFEVRVNGALADPLPLISISAAGWPSSR